MKKSLFRSTGKSAQILSGRAFPFYSFPRNLPEYKIVV
jgi:hypothetical protein